MRRGGGPRTLSAMLLMSWAGGPGQREKGVMVILWLSVNCLCRHKDKFARGQSIFKRATLPVTTSQTLIIPPHPNSVVHILPVSTTTGLMHCGK